MHFNFHQELRVENWPVQINMFLRDIQERIVDLVDRDCIADARSRMSRGSVLPAEPHGPSHQLFRKHPLLCGGILLSVQVLVQEAGTMVADAWGSLQYACTSTMLSGKSTFSRGCGMIWSLRWLCMDLTASSLDRVQGTLTTTSSISRSAWESPPPPLLKAALEVEATVVH